MKYYPVNLNLEHRQCLVVGGGAVGTRKVRGLLDCGARVTVISPEVSETLSNLSDKSKIRLVRRPFIKTDLEGAFLVIGATNDEKLNRRIHREAEKLGLLCNIADRPEVCNFILPSVVRRGSLTISISTSGQSPAMAKKLRKELELQFGDEYRVLLQLMGGIRQKLLAQAHAPEAHRPLFESLLNADLLSLVRNDNRADINRLLSSVLGSDFTYETLMESADSETDSPTT